MKNKLILFLGGLLIVGSLTGCGQGAEPSGEVPVSTQSTQQIEIDEMALGQINASFKDGENNSLTARVNESGSTVDMGSGDVVFDNAAYVMIYNPLIYSESGKNVNQNALNSGYLGGQILTGLNRAGELDGEEEPLNYTISQGDFPTIDFGAEKPEIKAGGLDPIYKKGDSHKFYYQQPMERKLGDFKCLYAGDYCYIWSVNNSITEQVAEVNGTAFDSEIYEQVVKKYGTGRFTENGGKVNVLMYPMDGGLGGFFWSLELFASSELRQTDIDSYKLNTDHAIIHIASNMDLDTQVSTLSHEFQHLIAFTDTLLSNTDQMSVWINEAMSANAEALIDPTALDATAMRTVTYYDSDSFKKGQSLYNFATYSKDIGAYGTVALFQAYVEQLGGEDVFAKFHKYWRTDTSADKSVATGLKKAMPAKVVKEIDEKYAYGSGVTRAIRNEDEVWLSKLALDFYIENVIGTTGRLDVYAEQKSLSGRVLTEDEWMMFFRSLMIYDQINAVNIEGGGSVLVATKNGSYAIPNDADNGLVYVAFDKDFNIIGTTADSAYNRGDNAVAAKPGADDFLWNGGTDIFVIANKANKGSAKDNLLTGTQDCLIAAGMKKVTREDAGSDVASQVEDVLNGKTLPGILIVQYDPKNSDKTLESKLAEAYAAGICVYTIGYGSVDVSKMTWNVHFDVTKFLEKSSDHIDTFTGLDKEIQNTGKTVGQCIVNSVNGPKNHFYLHCN